MNAAVANKHEPAGMAGTRLPRATPISSLSGNYDRPFYICEHGKLGSRRDGCGESLFGCADSQREKAKSSGLALPALPHRFGGAAEGNSSPIDSANGGDLYSQCPRIATCGATSDMRDRALHRRSFFNENVTELRIIRCEWNATGSPWLTDALERS